MFVILLGGVKRLALQELFSIYSAVIIIVKNKNQTNIQEICQKVSSIIPA